MLKRRNIKYNLKGFKLYYYDFYILYNQNKYSLIHCKKCDPLKNHFELDSSQNCHSTLFKLVR